MCVSVCVCISLNAELGAPNETWTHSWEYGGLDG